MKAQTIQVLETYLNLSGKRGINDFNKLYDAAVHAQKTITGHEYNLMEFVKGRMKGALVYAARSEGGVLEVEVMEYDIAAIEKRMEAEGLGKPPVRKSTKRKSKKSGDLGKIVDHGKELPESNSDKYWGREGLDLVFSPDDENVRVGEKIPPTYKYSDMHYLEGYYGLRAFEFGNWLSQQDRQNYLSGLGMALYDLHKLLHFTPKQLGIEGRLGITFGSRGRGKNLSHFDPATFSINLTRYSRPVKLEKRKLNYKRVNLILQDGGSGWYAKEYGHALDHFVGMFIEKTECFQISGGSSTEPAPPNPAKVKYSKTSIRGLMDNLLYRIIWKSRNVLSNYYQRLTKRNVKKFDRQRNEIFARAFEMYVYYKLHKHKGKNIFLTKAKYDERLYLTLPEMQKLETDFDALISAIKKQL